MLVKAVGWHDQAVRQRSFEEAKKRRAEEATARRVVSDGSQQMPENGVNVGSGPASDGANDPSVGSQRMHRGEPADAYANYNRDYLRDYNRD
jgi:hypothetical protein